MSDDMTQEVFIGRRGEFFMRDAAGRLYVLTDFGSWLPIRAISDVL